MTATFYIKPPQYISKVKRNEQRLLKGSMPVSKKPDLDNYVKALMDSISDSHLIWKDDGQVAEIKARKLYSLNPRIELEIEEIK